MGLTRFVALVMLLAAGLGQYEAVWGEVRDGAVHHESNAAALGHSLVANGDHGHEDGGHPEHGSRQDDGSDHEHGSSTDHCTHQHGTSVPVAVAGIFLGAPRPFPPLGYTFSSPEWTPPGVLMPPRA